MTLGMTAAEWSVTRARAPQPSAWKRYLGHHGKSFAFASAFMPADDRARIAGVYAWCRYTDDLVDVHTGDDAEARLDAWLELTGDAYNGTTTGVELLDEVMPGARAAGVPFTCMAELIEGMRMDLRHVPCATDADLRLYTWRAAGTVGLWLASMYGVRDPWALERAARLGQAMQLTNIIRDVGEDLSRGRVYIPRHRLDAYGFTVAGLERARAAGTLPGDGWIALTEDLIALAEADYAAGRAALHHLPASFRRAACVASYVYEGIHDAVRRIGYRTLHQRAATSGAEKLMLAARAMGQA